ncbi:uncharacterized protein LOC127712670 isoform X2 [Mytilus californianus]|uniref:uncharacterized protein LOC127712670 isoform X2 n=1 Tax=Mytilus californianus TaxID=6549 RepID=UPI0022451FEC|nr:uncharacterized protein LOC127712670 isoform X2 [Mytilus californianus]
MSSCLIFCILISFSNSYKLFVKKYSTVEISCQFTTNENDNVSWYFEESTLIAIRKDVNPDFKSKFKINGYFNLQILNFTEADQGRYMCHGISGGKYQQCTVILKLCNNSRNSDVVHETSIICTKDNNTQFDDTNNLKTLISIVTRPTSEYSRITNRKEKREKERLMKYTCLALNKEQCVTNNHTFQLQVKWILSDEEEYTRETQDVEDTYTCKCNSSNMAENVYCNGTVYTYFSNRTMFLQDLKNSSAALYECEIDLNEMYRIPIPSSDIKPKPLYLVYVLTGVFFVCGIPLVSIFLWCVRRAFDQFKLNAENVARLNEPHDLPVEGYSSIDRRRRIEIGQAISYKANRASKASITDERGDGSLLFRNSTNNQNFEQTRSADRLRVEKIKTTTECNTETPILNYIDLQFNSVTAGPKFVIHGSTDKTPYADIDLTIKADPLPESDSSDDDETNHNDEFLTLNDIQKLRKPV